MVRVIDRNSRKKAVLAATINKYIKNPVPVASEDITEEFSLSSASIRNTFAELEADGYLTHPYTSAGRIPTDKGYRYYVDFLISQIELLDVEKNRIASEYKDKVIRLEDALEKTSGVVSSITHCASIVSFLDWHDKLFYKGISFIMDQPEFQDLNRLRLIIDLIEEKEEILDILNREFEGKTKIYIGGESGCQQITGCSLVVSNYCINRRPVGRLAILGPTRMEYGHVISAIEYISDVLTGVLEDI